jgi:hypothetical protein
VAARREPDERPAQARSVADERAEGREEGRLGVRSGPLAPSGAGLQPATLLQLQRTVGNAVVAGQLLRQGTDPADDRAAAQGLLVDDAAEPSSPAQMRLSMFLTELRTAATATAREAVGASPWQALIDPSVDQWLQGLRALDSGALERRIRDEVPAARTAAEARGYIDAICARIRTSVEQQLSMEGAAGSVPGHGAAATAGAPPGPAGTIASAVSSLTSILFKRRPGVAASDVGEGAPELGAGSPLDGTTRGRMEDALGQDLSRVRVHTDARAAATAARHGALGFAIGSHVGFAVGAYRPGSVVGDALLAHELAHVAQQSTMPGLSGDAAVARLEDDADSAALGAVARLHGGAAERAGRARPLLRSGLRLMSCAPARGPAPIDPHQRYEYYLEDGSARLASAEFGTPWAPANQTPDFEHDKYDKDYWEWDGDPVYSRVLQVKAGVSASKAVRELFENLGKWRVDCDHLIQLSHFWAQLNTFGDEAFERRAPKIQLRPRGSTGLKTRAHHGRNGPREPWRVVEDVKPGEAWLRLKPDLVGRDTDQLVSEAPVGSRVRWTNLKASTSDAFRHENSLKLGSDKFAAAGFTKSFLEGGGNAFTRAELEERLAKNAHPSADRGYITQNVFIDEIEHFESP